MDVDVRPLTADHEEAAYRLRVQAFTSEPGAEYDPSTPYLPPERRLGAFAGDRLVGHLATWDFGQWYGGRRVPMGGVAGVAIAPDARGRGVASRLLARALVDMRERGEVLSALYPATHVPYRRFGWEVAGVWVRRTVPTAALRDLPRPAVGTTVRPGAEGDLAAVGDAYRRWARHRPGMLDRSALWTRRVLAPDREQQLYVAERDGDVVGYAAFEHEPPDEAHASFRVGALDLLGADLDAELALWRLVASHSPVASTVRYVGPPEDPLLLLLKEHEMREDPRRVVWMSRLVDAPAALAARGFPPGLEVAVPLTVADPHDEENNGVWVLEVADGRGQLTRGGTGRVELDVGTFATLYGGYLSATELAHLGRLRGATTNELVTLTAAFGGPTPWMRDYF